MGNLALEPGCDLDETPVEVHGRLVTQKLSGFRYVGKAVTDISLAIAVGYFRLQRLLVQDFAYSIGNLANGVRGATAHVEHLARDSVRFKCQPAGLYDVIDTDEVPPLITIFEYKRTLIIQQTGSKNGQHPCVR